MKIDVLSREGNFEVGQLLNELSNSTADCVAIFCTQVGKRFEFFRRSARYWWRPIHEVIMENSGLLIFERKMRGIGDVESYKGMKNYYWSERFKIGSYMIHELNTIGFIEEVCQGVELIIELGGFHGGLTLQLSDTFPDAEIHTFDIQLFDGMKQIINWSEGISNITFYQENVLCKKNDNVLSLLKRNEKKFLYCDNGRKIEEVRKYAPHLKVGDILGVHDWDVEISWNKVKRALVNFEPIFHEELSEMGLLTRLWRKTSD